MCFFNLTPDEIESNNIGFLSSNPKEFFATDEMHEEKTKELKKLDIQILEPYVLVDQHNNVILKDFSRLTEKKQPIGLYIRIPSPTTKDGRHSIVAYINPDNKTIQVMDPMYGGKYNTLLPSCKVFYPNGKICFPQQIKDKIIGLCPINYTLTEIETTLQVPGETFCAWVGYEIIKKLHNNQKLLRKEILKELLQYVKNFNLESNKKLEKLMGNEKNKAARCDSLAYVLSYYIIGGNSLGHFLSKLLQDAITKFIPYPILEGCFSVFNPYTEIDCKLSDQGKKIVNKLKNDDEFLSFFHKTELIYKSSTENDLQNIRNTYQKQCSDFQDYFIYLPQKKSFLYVSKNTCIYLSSCVKNTPKNIEYLQVPEIKLSSIEDDVSHYINYRREEIAGTMNIYCDEDGDGKMIPPTDPNDYKNDDTMEAYLGSTLMTLSKKIPWKFAKLSNPEQINTTEVAWLKGLKVIQQIEPMTQTPQVSPKK